MFILVLKSLKKMTLLFTYTYTPWQKYKTTLKNEEKDIAYNL